MVLALLLGTLVLLAVLGVPLVFSMLFSGLITFYIAIPDLPLEIIPHLFIQGLDNFALLAIALFFLAGELMVACGVTQRLINFSQALVGHLKGGLGQVGIVASFLMAGVSGSAVADAAAVGSVLIDSMKKAGYPAGFAAALVETASILGPIIPPSIPMIIYAILSETSVGAMFLAGIVPGLMIAVGLGVVVYIRAGQLGIPVTPRASGKTIYRESRKASLAILAPLIIVGGVRGGVFTATEGGAIASVYVIFLGFVFYRAVSLGNILSALIRAARGTASVLVVLGASSIFAWIIANQGISHQFVGFISALDVSDWVLILMFNLLFLLIGMFLDPIAALIILVPIMAPLLPILGMDPIQFGVMLVLNLMIGLCTPPVGYLIYIVSDIGKVSALSVIRHSAPFILVLLLVLLLASYVPALTLFLPDIIRGH